MKELRSIDDYYLCDGIFLDLSLGDINGRRYVCGVVMIMSKSVILGYTSYN